MTLQVGDTATMSQTITDETIRNFADVTGDYNPVHLDDEYAKGTRFGRRIAHGMLGASLISALLANKLPGGGTVYLGQSLRFLAPAFPGDTLTAQVTVTKIRDDKPIVTLETICTNERGERLIEGEAVVLAAGE